MHPSAPPPPAPRPSATLVLLRQGAGGVEVLMLKRADCGDQNSLRWVFPGGLVDASDRQVHPMVEGLDDAAASARIDVARGGLDFWVAVLRETLEEAGVLVAIDRAGAPVDAAAHRPVLDAWAAQVHRLPRGEAGASYAALLAAQQWRLPAAAVVPIAHWITPVGRPKRFDTLFFLAEAPAGCAVRVDGVEITDHRWATAQDVLDTVPAADLGTPTRAVLRDIARHADLPALWAWVRAIGPITTVQPRLARDAHGRVDTVHPSHPAWAEIGWIDPAGRGTAFDTIRPNEPVELVPGQLFRVTADNGSVMTGPGTNTYLLRAAGDAWVLIDPGPDEAAHADAVRTLLATLGARLAAILVTHTHVDHSPAARALHAATGAPRHGRLAAHPERQDASFTPEVPLQGGERLDFGGGCVLRVVHTPGHASNHLCFIHEAWRLAFTGDHVMQGSTVVINPPDGHMATYLASLGTMVALAGAQYDTIAPGHGFLIEQPARVLQGLVAHRLKREQRVADALGRLGRPTVDELLAVVYDDVGPARQAPARRSLLAHLQHLAEQGRAVEVDGRWMARTVQSPM